MRRVVGLTVVMCGSLACSAEPSRDAGVSVADSAGVGITTSGAPLWGDAGWTIEVGPLVTVGGASGTPELAQVFDARFTEGGGFIVPDASTQELHRFDADGSLLWTQGGGGDGPGEYMSLMAAVPFVGDSIAAVDFGGMTIMDAGGAVGRTVPIERTGRYGHGFSAATPDGDLVLLPTFYSPSPVGENGRRWADAPVLLVEADGRGARTLVEVPHHAERFEGGRSVEEAFRSFGAGVADNERILWSRNDRAEIREFSLDGKLARIHRWEEPPTELSPELEAEYEAATRRMFEASPELSGTRLQDALDRTLGSERADHLPFHGSMLLDSNSYIWLSSYSFTGPSTQDWRVFDREGRWLGWVHVPSGSLVDVRPDRVLVVDEDELGVPLVRVHRLIGR